MNNHKDNMKKLIEAIDFAGEPEQKPGDQVDQGVKAPKGSGKFLGKPYKRESAEGEHPFKDKLVGESENDDLSDGEFMSDEAYNQLFSYVSQTFPDYKLSGIGPGDEPGTFKYQLMNSKGQTKTGVYDGQNAIGESPATELNQATAKARLPDRENREQRGVWQQHYQRALRNGRDDRAARRYADTLTSSESKFQTEDGLEEAPDVALDMATPDDKPQSVFQVPGLSPAARRLAATRELAKMGQQDQLSPKDQRVADLNKPMPQFNSKDYDTEDALIEALTKAYEDYVSNEKYSDDKIYPKKNQKPTADKKKVKAPKVVDPNNLSELAKWRKEGGKGAAEQTKAPNGQRPKGLGWELKQAGEQSGKDYSVWQRKTKKVEKPFKDAAATGNPRDFANEGFIQNAYDKFMALPTKKERLAAQAKKEREEDARKLKKMIANDKWRQKKRAEKKAADATQVGESKGKDPFADTPWNEKAVKAKQMSDYKKKTGLDKEAPKDPKTVKKDGKEMYEVKGPPKEQAKANDDEWAKISAYYEKLTGITPNSPHRDQMARQAWNKKNKKKVSP